MAKVLCVLYDDPVGGYPRRYARDEIPKLQHYPGGQTLPTPSPLSVAAWTIQTISLSPSSV